MTERVINLKGFFEEARAGRLTGIRCGGCGELAIPPKEFCASCQERDWHPVPLAGRGTIVSHTVIRVAPRGRGGEVPYAVAVVQLEEGAVAARPHRGHPVRDARAPACPCASVPSQIDSQTVVGFGPA